mmetsp:Transcript_24417/g.84320  ORF Transcript_24417/g.84320 Transcript_24417/m.84320 type:complete len:263 (-) Transcript_24417:76-864(-)
MAPRKEYVYPPGSETALDEPRICSMAYLMAHPCWCLKPASEVLPAGFPLDTVARKLWHPEGQPRSTAQEARRRSFFTAAPALMSVPPPPPPPKQRNPRARKPDNTIMCRSCIFGGDAAEGLVVYTSQSATRGLGYATKWTLADEGGGGALELTGTAAVVRQVSKHPVSSMLVDGGHVVCGNVEGVVSVWTADLAPRLRSSAHDLPVTCMATLQGAAVVLSASADGKLVATSTTPRPMPLFIKLIIFLLFVATCLVAAQQFLL